MKRACAGLLMLASAGFAADVTFNKDILPILQKNCQTCHRPGEIGPSSFLTYESTRPWARAIKNAVVSRLMPPWFADPKYGHFANDRRLSDADVAAIAAWVDGGAPEGDAKDRPAPVQWREGWNIQPDVIFEMPKPYLVPRQGTVEYTYFVVPTGFKEDTWVIDGEVRPGNRSVVHHGSVHVRPPGSLWMKDAKPGEPFVPAKTAPGAPPPVGPDGKPLNMRNEWLLGYVPGVHGEYFDKDHKAAKLIPAGSDLVFEMHYTANGQAAAEDRTKVGFVLAKSAPSKRLLTVPVANMQFEIPPGHPNYEGRATAQFDRPVQLVYSQPHMHLRGKDMDIQLEYPTGEKETVVSVPRFDFDWQLIYYEQKARELPKGTRINLIAHWDNSANNKSNPDPKATIRWGDQSWDEMIFAWIGVVVDPGLGLDEVMSVRVGNEANSSRPQ
jgi:hypothetical protein